MIITAYFSQDGVAKTGLSPELSAWVVSSGTIQLNAVTMTEIAGGWYKYDWGAGDDTVDYVFTADGDSGDVEGMSDFERNVFASNSIEKDIADLNDLSAAQVNAEVDTALQDINLDHLLVAAADGSHVVDDSVIAQLVSKNAVADWDSFDNETDALEAISDKVVAASPQNHMADSGTANTGTVVSGDYAETQVENDSYWQVAPVIPAVGGFGLNADLVFNIGTGRKADQVTVSGHFVTSPPDPGAGRSVQVWAYDYVLAAYVQISNSSNDFTDNATDETFLYFLTTNMTKADGEVILRFTSESTDTDDDWFCDFVSVTSVAVEAAGLTADAIQQAVWNRADSGHDENTLGYNLSKMFLAKSSVVSVTSAIQFVMGAGSAVDDAYNGMLMMVEDKTDGNYEIRRIVDWIGATKEVIVDRAYSFTPAPDDDCYLVGNAYADVNATHIQGAQDEVSGIKSITDNLPNSGALTDIDSGVNNIEAKLPTNEIMGSSTKTDKDDEIDAIKAKTDNLPTDPADQSQVEVAITTAEGNIRGADGDDLKDISDQIGGITGGVDLSAEVSRLLGLSHENIYIDNTDFDINGNLQSARVRTYSVAASVGTDSDVLKSYKINCTPSGVGTFTNWQQTTYTFTTSTTTTTTTTTSTSTTTTTTTT